MAKVCFWTATNGDYNYMAKAMVLSARKVGMTDDFLVLSDKEVSGAKFIKAEWIPDERWGCWFKFRYLKRYLAGLDYDYLAWLDAENYFVRKPRNVLSMMHGSPLHSFLECDLTCPSNKRTDWWDCPNWKVVQMYRNMGVASRRIFNVNGGFFIIKRSFIDEFVRITDEFYQYCLKAGYRFVDEVPLAYATQLVCGDSEMHVGDVNQDVWACDWTNAYVNRLPDGQPWLAEHYMLGVKQAVNPAIVHAMRCKEPLIEIGKHT
jgi:hypothetical protein